VAQSLLDRLAVGGATGCHMDGLPPHLGIGPGGADPSPQQPRYTGPLIPIQPRIGIHRLQTRPRISRLWAPNADPQTSATTEAAPMPSLDTVNRWGMASTSSDSW